MAAPKSPPQANPPASALPAWKLEDAKSRFSELVRVAHEQGPQRVTVRGNDAVVVISAGDYARMVPVAPQPTLLALFGDSPFSRMDFDADQGRGPAPFREIVEF